MSNPDLLDAGTDLVSAVESNTAMANWSESRKNDFCKTFEDRVRVSRFVLEATAQHLEDAAKKRRFVSEKHFRDLKRPKDAPYHLCDNSEHGRYINPERCAGRATEELQEIAKERALAILDSLPALGTVVQIINPDLAAKIDRRDALNKKGQTITDQLSDASEPIVMSELDQSMSIAEFRALVQDRDKQRKMLHVQLQDCTKEHNTLELAISKALYAGLPGLSDAVVKVIVNHYARSTALDSVTRRVTEQVKFGDSAEALGMLRRFEGDEATVPDSIKNEFTEALEKLKLSVAGKKAKAPKKIL